MDKATEKFWERVNWLKEHRTDTFYVHMLDAVMSRAKDGEVGRSCILEKRGVITFPRVRNR